MNRIFISYRSSDGKKDAARLAGDLNQRFGDDQVFYDKHDLVGGRSWREAINATLGTQPVVLVLVTPDLFGATHPDGGRRIDRTDDPIRNELLEARQNGAVVVPLLTEGMTMPASQTVPEALRFFTEAHAQRLRTDDWSGDLQRIVADLQAHGIHPPEPDPAPLLPDRVAPDLARQGVQSVVHRIQRGLMYLGGVMVALLAIGFLLPGDPETPPAEPRTGTPQPVAATTVPPTAAEPLSTAQASDDISGVWWSVDAAGHRTRVQITLYGSDAVLQTDAIPVAWYPEWQAYAQRLAAQGMVFDHIQYGGSGQWAQGRLQVPVNVHSTAGHGPLDTGNVTLGLSADGRELSGQLWSHGEQSHTPLRLVRRP